MYGGRAAIHAGHMKKHLRTLLVGVSALVALGTLSACSGGTSTEATSTSAPAPATTDRDRTAFPQSARYVADMKAADGKTMTIGISVDGTDVAAYACNGTDDEAWFFGNQTDGKIDIKSRFRDTLKAEFDGTDVEGDLTMNGVAYQFTAAPVSGAAGMYTADARRCACILGGPRGRHGDRRAVQPAASAAATSSRPNCSNSTSSSSATACATSGSCSRPQQIEFLQNKSDRGRRSTART